ncbi:hypothetical protein ACG93S_28855 [Streptomyces sp. WAC01490]|uniref:hypothetical protein n=1 Tax=Streptomyces TaxID=1883 RepID=UPI00365BFEC1
MALELADRWEANQAAAQNAVSASAQARLAADYEAATTDQARAQIADNVAHSFTLAEAGTIRRAAKAIELGTPKLILRATAEGVEPTEIATELGVTDSYVRRIIREQLHAKK